MVSFKQIQRGWGQKNKVQRQTEMKEKAGTRHAGSWQWSDNQSRRHRCLYTQKQMKHVEAEGTITEVRRLTGHGEQRQDKTTITKIRQEQNKLESLNPDTGIRTRTTGAAKNRQDGKCHGLVLSRVISWFILKVFESSLTSYVTLPAFALFPSCHRDGLSLWLVPPVPASGSNHKLWHPVKKKKITAAQTVLF